ncbi:hypothetical protein Tco_0638595 [Tanacetum coccineum]
MYRSTCSSLCLALTQARTLLYGIDWIYYIEYAGARCLLSFRLSQTHQESFKLLLQIYYCIFFGFFDVSAIVASEYNSVYSRTGHSLASSGGMIASYAAGRVLTVGVFRSICDLDSNEPVMVDSESVEDLYVCSHVHKLYILWRPCDEAGESWDEIAVNTQLCVRLVNSFTGLM